MKDCTTMFSKIAETPQIKRGQVWCKSCGQTQRVDGTGAMQNGWPRCCGHTMTIDSPEEQKRLAAEIGRSHHG